MRTAVSLKVNGRLAQRRISAQPTTNRAGSRIAQQDHDFFASDNGTRDACLFSVYSDSLDCASPEDSSSTFVLQQWRALPERYLSCIEEIAAARRTTNTIEGQSDSALIAPAHLIQPGNTTHSRSSQFGGEFVLQQRIKIAQGWPEDVVLGPDVVEMSGIFTDVRLTTHPITVSQWVAQVASRFDTLGVPEQLGLILLCGRYLRVFSMV